MRILLVDNLLIRRYGKLRMGPGRALACGAVRGNHRLCEFSDRDLARYMGLGIRPLGEKLVNKALVKTAVNFHPDAILLGHCDFIRNETLNAIRAKLPQVRIAHFNVDPMCDKHPQEQMRERMRSCDVLFATTAGAEYIKQFTTGKNVVAFMPNPVDEALEVLDNSKKDESEFEYDVFYAGQPREGDPRLKFIDGLTSAFKDKPINFHLVGMGGNPAIVGGYAYDELLAKSKMALNISRFFGMKWYSSDRIAHLMGSGILTAIYDGDRQQDFFADDEALWYHDVNDLTEKLLYFQSNDDKRKKVAAAGRRKYHEIFSGERILNFMLETLFQVPYTSDYEWQEEVYT